MVNFTKMTPVKEWTWEGDHAEKISPSAEEIRRVYEADQKMTKFQIAGLGIEFSCVPAQTTNFEIFKHCNPELDNNSANQVWKYYKEKFIHAKMMNIPMTKFRDSMSRFIRGDQDSTISYNKNPFDPIRNEIFDKKKYIEGVINLCLWIGLQYKVDTLLDELCENKEVISLEKNLEPYTHFHLTNNQYTSYFYNEPKHDCKSYEHRKLLVKKHMYYKHKNRHTFVCNSEKGPVILNIQHSIGIEHTIPLLDRLLSNGHEIVILQGRMTGNIDNSVKFLRADKWFVE